MKRALIPLVFSLCLSVARGEGLSPPLSDGQGTAADANLTAYFAAEVARVEERSRAELAELANDPSQRPEQKRRLQEMLGLWPMPERTDLRPVVTEIIELEHCTVEKVSFQAMPGLYCTANLYLPRLVTEPVPAILNASGHHRMKENSVSLGNKTAYQANGAWYAERGYVCLVLDSLQLGEFEGVHTGTRDLGLWWWNARGYTPAGVEAWFGMRALDYLCSRPEVDAGRLGVTGHSGGGAYSWTIAALDDRIQVAAPLAGMTDIRAHILHNLMDRHCDCNFLINTYRWDFPQLAALVAPRPLLIGATDQDPIFPLDATLRIHQAVREVYAAQGASDQLGLAIAPGLHQETPELQLAVIRWFDRHLKGEQTPVNSAPVALLPPARLRVFDGLPDDAINADIAQTFVPQAPTETWTVDALRERAFSGWPSQAAPLDLKPVFAAEQQGLRMRAWDFTSQHHVRLRLYCLEPADAKPGIPVRLAVLDESGGEPGSWVEWLGRVRMGFGPQLEQELARSVIANAPGFQELAASLRRDPTRLAFVAPRGIGLDEWSGDAKRQSRIRRRFMLLGQTVDGMRVWDIRRATAALRSALQPDDKIELEAHRVMAGNALYAALFEPSVSRLTLIDPPASHRQGPDYLRILQLVDLPAVQSMVAETAELTVTH